MAITKSRQAPAYTGQAYPITDHTFDVVVVGAGGAGLRACGSIFKNLSSACLLLDSLGLLNPSLGHCSTLPLDC